MRLAGGVGQLEHRKGSVMRTIVVGVDRSYSSRNAARWAARLAAAVRAELLVVRALNDPSLDDVEHVADHQCVSDEWGLEFAADARAKVRTQLVPGDPRVVLDVVAAAEGADLVVLGRSGDGGGPGFAHLGSVVEFAAHHWPWSLAVVPDDHPASIARVALGVDGSPNSLEAVDWCARVAPAFDATVLAVCVQEPLLEWTHASHPDNWRRELGRHLCEWTRPLVDAEVEVERTIKADRHVADGLLDVAAAHDADLLVIGLSGLGGFSGLRAGGVAIKALHRASIPLVLVPRPA